MIRSLQRSLIVLSVAVLAGGGFVWGRARGLDVPPLRHRNHISHNMTATTDSEGIFSSARQQDDGVDTNPTKTFEVVLDHVQNDFVEGSGTDAKLSNGALTQMLASLDDPKTGFLDPKMRAARQDALLGRYSGIGAVLTVIKVKKEKVDYRYLTIVDVMPGSPAEKAGLKSGDILYSIDDRWVMSYSIAVDIEHLQKEQKEKTKTDSALKDEAKKISERFQKAYTYPKAIVVLTTETGKTLKIAVQREGQAAPTTVSVTTATTQVEPVEFKTLDKQIGWLHIRQFNAKAAEQFAQALEKSGGDLKGLIVDLRGNPGGVKSETLDVNGYQAAIKLISLLTDHAKATVESKPGTKETVDIPGSKKITAPIVVLVDPGTANLSEMVATILHDSAKAKIVGTKTFGDSVLQLFTVLKNGTGIEMTTAHLLNAQGAEWNKGLTPDITATGEDAVKRAIDALGA